MTACLPALLKNPLFAEASPDRLRALAGACEVRAFDPGEVVVRAGTPLRWLIQIADGTVELYRKNKDEELELLLGTQAAPAIFGDAELFGGNFWSISVRCIEPATLILIPPAAFQRLIDTDHRALLGLYRDACARHFLCVQIAQFHALYRTEQRILRLLWEQAGLDDERPLVRLEKSRLARALGINRKTVERNLKMLEAEGLLELRGRDARLIGGRDLDSFRPLEPRALGASWGGFRSA